MFRQTIRLFARTSRIGVIAGSLAMVACTGVVSPAPEQLDLRSLDAAYNPCTATPADGASMVSEHIRCLARASEPRVADASLRSKEV